MYCYSSTARQPPTGMDSSVVLCLFCLKVQNNNSPLAAFILFFHDRFSCLAIFRTLNTLPVSFVILLAVRLSYSIFLLCFKNRPRAPGLDPHPAQRASPTLPRGYHHARTPPWRSPELGLGKMLHTHVFIHPRLLLAHCIPRDARRRGVGESEQGHRRCQSPRLSAHALRKSADASFRNVPWILHGAGQWNLEL